MLSNTANNTASPCQGFADFPCCLVVRCPNLAVKEAEEDENIEEEELLPPPKPASKDKDKKKKKSQSKKSWVGEPVRVRNRLSDRIAGVVTVIAENRT